MGIEQYKEELFFKNGFSWNIDFSDHFTTQNLTTHLFHVLLALQKYSNYNIILSVSLTSLTSEDALQRPSDKINNMLTGQSA